MRIYFSGGGGLKDTPEGMMPEVEPHIMFTFHNFIQRNSGTTSRFKAHKKRIRNENNKRKNTA